MSYTSDTATAFKPEGYQSLSAYLIVDDPQAELDFIKAVFDVEPIFVHRTESGGINHAEIRIDDTLLMIGGAPGQGMATNLHLYVPDVDATFAAALAAGATVVQEPVQKGDTDRRGGVTSPAGTIWWVATQMAPR